MEKKSLLKLLDESIVVEELAIPIYSEHLDSALFWSGFKSEITDEIKKTLLKIANESKEHIRIIQKLKNKIGG